MGARSGRSASAGFAALQLICRRRILGEKEGRIDPVIRGVLVHEGKLSKFNVQHKVAILDLRIQYAEKAALALLAQAGVMGLIDHIRLQCADLRIPSVDKGRHSFDGQKCAHTASSPLAIRQVFPAGLFLSGHISAPAKLLRTCQRWIFQGFLVFETQAGACPPRRKGQKSPKRRGDRRVCPC